MDTRKYCGETNCLKFVFSRSAKSRFTLKTDKMSGCQAVYTPPFQFQDLPKASVCVMCFNLQVIRCNVVIDIFADVKATVEFHSYMQN